MKRISFPTLLIVAIAAMLWLPWLFAKGMFMDGIYNAIFAQNLLNGVSTFWAPQTNDYSNPAYWHNPPLSMLTLGVFYKVFGDHYYLDRIYSLICAILQITLIIWAWKILCKDDEQRKEYSWLPVLLWITSPLTGWCYSNNLMENTMSLFTTLALIQFLLFIKYGRYLLPVSILGASSIVLATLTKGPVGFFPLAAPILFLLATTTEKRIKVIAYSALQFIWVVLLLATLFSFTAPENYLQHYIDVQLAPAIMNVASETGNGVVYKELVLMLLPAIIVSGIVIVFNRYGSVKNEKTFYPLAISFFLIGLSATLPIALSTKQRKFYLLPSLPVFALGFSVLILPALPFLQERVIGYINERRSFILKVLFLFVIVICGYFSIRNAGKLSRDKEMLVDIERMKILIGNESQVCSDWQLYSEWSLRAYCIRYYNIKMFTPDRISETRFYMTKPESTGDELWSQAEKVYAGSTFDLYEAK